MYDMVERGVADYLKFLNEVLRSAPKPKWTTKPKRVSFHNERVKLRQFSLESKFEQDEVPTIIIPPQAGHHSNIADYGENQSLARAVLDAEKKSVYVTEWLSATPQRCNEDIASFIDTMDECIGAIGKEKVNLIGLCQGGWQSAIYAAMHPEKVNALVIAAAPIDFKADGGKIQDLVEKYPMSLYESLVKVGGGNMSGKLMVFSFKMLNPFDRFFKDYQKLYENINDEEYLTRDRKFRDWYEWTQDLPGRFYLEVVKDLFKDNKLIKGELEIKGEKVDLGKIDCPLYLIAGEKDDITLENQVFNMEQYVSSKKIEKMVVPAGHIGVFMGRKVLKDYWPQVLNQI